MPDSCNRQNILDAIDRLTDLFPYQMKAEADKQELAAQLPHVAAMIDYVLYDGESPSPELNDIKIARAAELVHVASAILYAVTGNPWNGPEYRFPDPEIKE